MSDVCGKKNEREHVQYNMQNECSNVQSPADCGEPVETNTVLDHIDNTEIPRHIDSVSKRVTLIESGIHLLQQSVEALEQARTEINEKIIAIERQLVDVKYLPRQAGGQLAPVNIDQKIRLAMENQQGSNDKKFQKLEVKTGTYEQIVSVYKREIESTINAIERMEKEKRIDKAIVEGQQRLYTLERTNAAKDANIAELELRAKSTELASYDGYTIWKVEEFSKKKQDAIQGNRKSIYSPPFYTSRRGYTLCARIYPNGNGRRKGTHVSLFFVVMRGQFDTLQAWPFKQRVTIWLNNQNGKEHVLDSFRPNQRSSAFERPTSDMNIANGFPLFISLEDLQSSINGFLKDDTLFVKVVIDLNGPPLPIPLQIEALKVLPARG